MGPVEEIMDVVYKIGKSRHHNTVEKYIAKLVEAHISVTKDHLKNRIFNILVCHDTQQMA
jgi:hypothetical protein